MRQEEALGCLPGTEGRKQSAITNRTGDATDAAAVQALAALAGIRVDPIELGDGSQAWIVTRWHLTRQFGSLAEVCEFLGRMGVYL